MQTHGIIINGVTVAQRVGFQCLKCGEFEVIEFRHEMSEKTIDCFKNLIDACLCLNCYTDKHIPEAAECLVN